MASGVPYLMYHELELPGRPMCDSEPGYVRYVLGADDFRAQMDALKTAGIRGISVSQALASPRSGTVVLTFDDGSETDLITAAPILRDAGFNATFYITSGFVGRPGYLTPGQLRELSDSGFEIGCHSMTHPYLDELSTANLQREIAAAKLTIENIIGRAVEHFSCPGGRWSPEVVEVARSNRYRSVATSRIGLNTSNTDPFCLARIAVMRGTRLDRFERLARGRGFWKMQLKDFTRSASKRVLGNTYYDRIRARLLDRD